MTTHGRDAATAMTEASVHRANGEHALNGCSTRSTANTDIARRAVRIMHLVDPPTGLFHPRMIAAAARRRHEVTGPAAAAPVDATIPTK